MKKILICQVKNSFEYIPLFLAHHEKLFDEIHIIDQCSNTDLRDLNKKQEFIHFYKTSYSFFNAMIGINAVLEFKKIRSKSDFTFILDIDEFLPFHNKQEFEIFLNQHENSDAIQFQWCNGLNFSENEEILNSTSDLRFSNQTSSVKKLAYNAKKTQYFLPYHGNHNAKFHFLKFAGCKKRVTISKSDVPLLHIPFSSTKNLLEKVNEFDKEEFVEKIINRHARTKEIYRRASSGNATKNDLCFFAANYRTIGREDEISTHFNDFEKTSLFSSLQTRIDFWRKSTKQCNAVKNHPSVAQHEDIARKILGEKTIGGRYFFYQAIKKYASINDENIINLKN